MLTDSTAIYFLQNSTLPINTSFLEKIENNSLVKNVLNSIHKMTVYEAKEEIKEKRKTFNRFTNKTETRNKTRIEPAEGGEAAYISSFITKYLDFSELYILGEGKNKPFVFFNKIDDSIECIAMPIVA